MRQPSFVFVCPISIFDDVAASRISSGGAPPIPQARFIFDIIWGSRLLKNKGRATRAECPLRVETTPSIHFALHIETAAPSVHFVLKQHRASTSCRSRTECSFLLKKQRRNNTKCPLHFSFLFKQRRVSALCAS